MQGIRTFLLFSFALCFGFCVTLRVAASQAVPTQEAPIGQRDANATAIMQKSLSAMGGEGAIAAVHSVNSSGTILKTESSVPIPFLWEESVTGNHFEFRRETTRDGKVRVFASGHGQPGFGFVGAKARRLSAHMSLAAVPLEIPAVLLYVEFQNPALSMISFSPGSDGLLHVRIVDHSDAVMTAITQQDWYFDPRTAMPVRVEYNLPEARNALNVTPVTCVYTGWTTEQEVQYPIGIQALESGKVVSQISISSIQPNTSMSSADFDLPLEDLRQTGSKQ